MKFDINKLSELLKERCPEVRFAFLHGSAKEGSVKEDSDIDIAFFVEDKPTLELYKKVSDCVHNVAPGVECDTGILNHAEPIYRFEALKGKLLFCREQEEYLRFFSLTCREYESQMADYERQHKYRLEYIAKGIN